MALISCPNCKNPVSDKAAVCPNCGYAGMGQSADVQNKIKCEDCGNEFENNLASCPVCGCPASISGVKENKKKRKIMVISVIAIVLLVVYAIGVNFVKQAALAEYSANMTKAAQTMIDGASKAENVGNLVCPAEFDTKASGTMPFMKKEMTKPINIQCRTEGSLVTLMMHWEICLRMTS